MVEALARHPELLHQEWDESDIKTLRSDHYVLCEHGHFSPTAFERKFIELRVWEPWMVENAQFDLGFDRNPPGLEGKGYIKNMMHVTDWQTLEQYLGAEGRGLGLEHAVDEYDCDVRDYLGHTIKIHPPAIDRGFYVVLNIEWVLLLNK